MLLINQTKKVIGKYSLLEPLKYKDFRLLVSGQMISTFGDCLYMIALPWLIFGHKLGSQSLGYLSMYFAIARVIGIAFGGMYIDKLGSRKIMLFTDIWRAILVGLMAFIEFNGYFSFLTLGVIVSLLGLLSGLFRPAYFAITPIILPSQTLQKGNALNQISMQMTGLIGPAIAGIVITSFATSGALLIDGVSFFISIITLTLMSAQVSKSITKGEEKNNNQSKQEEQFRSVWQYLLSDKSLIVLFFIFACINLLWNGLFDVALPTYIIKDLGLNVKGNGYIISAASIGALIGGTLSGRLSNLHNRVAIALILGITQGILIFLVPFIGGISWKLLLILFAVLGVCNGMANIILITRTQQGVPGYIIGRVMSVMQFIMLSMAPISEILAGSVCSKFGAGVMFIVCGIGLIAPFSLGLFIPSVHKVKPAV